MKKDSYQTDVIFIDKGDWLSAFICLIFLIIFPIAIVAIWFEPRDIAPLYFLIPFALVFALSVPFLLKQVISARTRKIVVNPSSGLINIHSNGLFGQSNEKIFTKTVEKLVFETSDNDGYWYNMMIKFEGSKTLKFAQGSHKPTVEADFKRMVEALEVTRSDIPIEYIKT